jgi:hypothetical protein
MSKSTHTNVNDVDLQWPTVVTPQSFQCAFAHSKPRDSLIRKDCVSRYLVDTSELYPQVAV